MSRTEINRAAEDGIDDIDRIFGIDDLVRGDVIVVATGISNGDLLRGVRYMAEGARTQSLVLCSRCNRVRFVDSIHLFSRPSRGDPALSTPQNQPDGDSSCCSTSCTIVLATRGIEGYRRMSKAELADALEIGLDGQDQPAPEAPASAPASGPTEVESLAATAFGWSRCAARENALALETLERLADAAEAMAADADVRLVAITGAGTRIFSAGADLARSRAWAGAEVAAAAPTRAAGSRLSRCPPSRS